jgi:hypothetical protein
VGDSSNSHSNSAKTRPHPTLARVESAWRAFESAWSAFASWFTGVQASAWSAAAAWCALLISFVNLWYSVIRVWWRNRRASPAAQLDLLSYQSKGEWKEDERVVVTNHGPHVVKNVNVEVFDGDGQPLTATDSEVKALWPSMPVERLHTGQSLYLTLNLSQGTVTSAGVVFDPVSA